MGWTGAVSTSLQVLCVIQKSLAAYRCCSSEQVFIHSWTIFCSSGIICINSIYFSKWTNSSGKFGMSFVFFIRRHTFLRFFHQHKWIKHLCRHLEPTVHLHERLLCADSLRRRAHCTFRGIVIIYIIRCLLLRANIDCWVRKANTFSDVAW